MGQGARRGIRVETAQQRVFLSFDGTAKAICEPPTCSGSRGHGPEQSGPRMILRLWRAVEPDNDRALAYRTLPFGSERGCRAGNVGTGGPLKAARTYSYSLYTGSYSM